MRYSCSCISDSYTFAITGSTETGNCSCVVEVLRTRLTFAFFHSAGVCPFVILSLKSMVVVVGAIANAMIEVPSTLVALWVFNFLKVNRIFFFLYSMKVYSWLDSV